MISEELWEEVLEQELEAEGEDDDDDFHLRRRRNGGSEEPGQAALEKQVSR